MSYFISRFGATVNAFGVAPRPLIILAITLLTLAHTLPFLRLIFAIFASHFKCRMSRSSMPAATAPRADAELRGATISRRAGWPILSAPADCLGHEITSSAMPAPTRYQAPRRALTGNDAASYHRRFETRPLLIVIQGSISTAS